MLGSDRPLSLSLYAVIAFGFIVVFFLPILSPAYASEPKLYYVDPENGIDDRLRDGSIDYPFKTLTYAMNERATAGQGDTIKLRGGDYKENHINHDWYTSCPYGEPDYTPCDAGEPEDFPIFLKNDVSIEAHKDIYGEYENVVITTAGNCNLDIFKTNVAHSSFPKHQWEETSYPELTQYVGIKFITKKTISEPWRWWEGSG